MICFTPRWLPWTFGLLLFLLAFALRAQDLDIFLTPDETRWACRSTNFWSALAEGRWTETYQKEHPGVVTMWLGGLGQPVDPRAGWTEACAEIEMSKLVAEAPRPALDAIRDRLFAGRLRVALLTSVALVLAYALAVGLLGLRAALLGGLLMAMEPFFLAHGRVLHLDAVTASLMLLSLLFLLTWVARGRRLRDLLLAGALAGLATANKSPAVFLVPMAGLVLLAETWDARRPGDARAWGRLVWEVARPLLLWGAAGLAAYVLVWPAMWVDPLGTLASTFGGAADYAGEGHEGGNYFLGLPVADPGPLFYPAAFLLRATVPGLVGLALAFWRALPAGRAKAPSSRAWDRRTALWLGLYALLFGIFMTTGGKKFDRYLLPAFPALALVAGWGWAGAVSAFLGWRARRAGRASGERASPSAEDPRATGVAAGLLFVALLGIALPYRPHYLNAYNPLAGGARTAPWWLLVGWGEGLGEVAAQLNAQPDAEGLEVATRYRSAFGPLFVGRALEMNKIDPATVDYYLFYLNQLQRDLDPELLARYRPGPYREGGFGEAHPARAVAASPPEGELPEPELIVRLGGIDYAWLFRNDSWAPAADFLNQRAAPGDVVLARAGSGFAEGYAGPVPLRTFDADAEAEEVRALLEAAFDEHEGVWLLRYQDLIPRPGLTRLEQDLATSSFRSDQAGFPELRIARYERVEADGLAGRAGAGERTALGATYLAEGEPVLDLEAVTLSATPLVWGRALGIELDWRARRELARNYKAFLHLVGPEGRRWAHEDRALGDEALVPSARWTPGERVVDERMLPLPPGMPPGDYELRIGVYDPETGDRLALEGEQEGAGYVSLRVPVARSPITPRREDLGLDALSPTGLAPGVVLLGHAKEGPAEGGAVLPLALFWEAGEEGAAERPGLARVELRAFDASGREVGRATSAPVPSLRLADWLVGDRLRGGVDLPLDGRARAGEGRLEARLLDVDGVPFAPEAVYEAPLVIDGPERTWASPEDVAPIGARLGDAVALHGVELPEGPLSPGEELAMTLWWEARGELEAEHTVFVHLVGPDGALRAQADAAPAGGARPTVSWLAGELVADPHALRVPEDAPPGRYALYAGMYASDSLVNLPATDAEGGRLPDDRVPVGAVEIR